MCLNLWFSSVLFTDNHSRAVYWRSSPLRWNLMSLWLFPSPNRKQDGFILKPNLRDVFFHKLRIEETNEASLWIFTKAMISHTSPLLVFAPRLSLPLSVSCESSSESSSYLSCWAHLTLPQTQPGADLAHRVPDIVSRTNKPQMDVLKSWRDRGSVSVFVSCSG